MHKNNMKFWTGFSIVMAVIGLGLTVAGIALGQMDTFWMLYAGIILVATFTICTFLFLGQAKRLSRMLDGKDLLAHWVFGQNEQQENAREEFAARKQINRGLLMIVTAFFVVIGGAFVVFGFEDFEEASGFLLIMGGVLALVWLVALLAPVIAYRRMKDAPAEVFVGPFGAWVMGESVQWRAPMTKPVSVAFEHVKDGALITVVFDVFARFGYQQHSFRIPVPKGREREGYDAAQRIAEVNGMAFITGAG
jgi:hypothetical protein